MRWWLLLLLVLLLLSFCFKWGSWGWESLTSFSQVTVRNQIWVQGPLHYTKNADKNVVSLEGAITVKDEECASGQCNLKEPAPWPWRTRGAELATSQSRALQTRREKKTLPVWETASFSRGGNPCACLPCPSEVGRGIVVEGPECLGIQWDLLGSSWQWVRTDKTPIRPRLYLNHRHSQGKPSARCGRLGINQSVPNGGASPLGIFPQCRRHRRHGFDPWVGKIPWSRKMAAHSSIFAWKIPWIRRLRATAQKLAELDITERLSTAWIYLQGRKGSGQQFPSGRLVCEGNQGVYLGRWRPQSSWDQWLLESYLTIPGIHGKSNSKMKVYSNAILPQETKISNKQPKLKPKATRGRRPKKPPKVSRRKEITEIRAEIHETERKTAIAKISEIKSWFFEKNKQKW